MFCSFFVSLLSYAQDKDPSSEFLLQLATEQLPKYLEMVKNDKIQNYGFLSESEMSNIVLGVPMQTCYLSADFYSAEKLNSNSCVVYANEYRIPLIINGEVRCFVVAGTIKGEWKLVSIGESKYAQNTYKAFDGYQFSKSDKIKLLLEPSSRTSYLFKSNNSDQTVEYYPIGEDSEMKIEMKKYNQSDLFTKLHQQYKNKQHEEDN